MALPVVVAVGGAKNTKHNKAQLRDTIGRLIKEE
jgi:hypothetical protein